MAAPLINLPSCEVCQDRPLRLNVAGKGLYQYTTPHALVKRTFQFPTRAYTVRVHSTTTAPHFSSFSFNDNKTDLVCARKKGDCLGPSMQYTMKAKKISSGDIRFLADRIVFVRILLFTTLLSNTLAFNDRLLRPTPRVVRNVARPMHQTPSYERRRKQTHFNLLKITPIFIAKGPPSDLDDASPVSWDEAIGAESVQLEDTGAISTKDKAILACFVIVAMGAFSGLLAVSPVGCWRYFAAGGACAAVSHAIPTPIDVVKVSKKSTKQPVLVIFYRF
jgi:hypothetical protein